MLCCDLIHGDLSPYNVLVGRDGPVVIDFPQVVGAAHNSQAEGFFLRDVENLRRHFVALDPALGASAGDGREIWRAYVRRELTPDFVPTGHGAGPARHRDRREREVRREEQREAHRGGHQGGRPGGPVPGAGRHGQAEPHRRPEQPSRPDQAVRPEPHGRPEPPGRPDQHGRPAQHGRPDQRGRGQASAPQVIYRTPLAGQPQPARPPAAPVPTPHRAHGATDAPAHHAPSAVAHAPGVPTHATAAPAGGRPRQKRRRRRSGRRPAAAPGQKPTR